MEKQPRPSEHALVLPQGHHTFAFVGVASMAAASHHGRTGEVAAGADQTE